VCPSLGVGNQLWGKQAQSGKPANRAKVQTKRAHGQQGADFNGVRDEKALAALPETERLAWRQLWADGEQLRAEAGGK
jgi:hypothetical protein